MPPFDPSTGYLPPGLHVATWAEVVNYFGWNVRRRQICVGLHRALINLQSAGCSRVLIDGSFVTAKDQPGDFDAAYDPKGVDGSLLDPILRRFDDERKAMKAKYFGEVFPWGEIACSVTGKLFLEFFQQDRSGIPKGAVMMKLGALA